MTIAEYNAIESLDDIYSEVNAIIGQDDDCIISLIEE